MTCAGPNARAGPHASRLLMLIRICVIVVLVTCLAACGSNDDGDEFEALKSDPLASITPAGTSLARRSEEGAGKPLGKTRAAEILSVFEVKNSTYAAARDDALVQARSAGWALEPIDSSGGVNGARTIGEVAAVVKIYPESDGPTSRLVIWLRAVDR
jgi:hypothetical protein